MFETPFGWLTEKRDGTKILENKKHFCSIVQASNNPDREKLFDLIQSKHFIKSSGPWRRTVDDSETLNPYQYHNYSNKEYMGKIDGLTYRDKIKFFSDTVFNIAYQYTNTDYLTQEKIVHAYAANTIPLFYGNQFIEEEGFNPNTFINCHKFENFEHLVQFLDELYNDKNRLVKYFEEPIFVNNELPYYFEDGYILDFFDKIIG